jgi:hypothetical protein
MRKSESVATTFRVDETPVILGLFRGVDNASALDRDQGASMLSTSNTVPDKGIGESAVYPGRHGGEQISKELRRLLADVFALYLKTKSFHWHMTGRHFRDYHLLLDDHAEQIFSMTDDIAERSRKIGGTTLRSISDITRHQRLSDSD